jgi:Tol biopolymer transport system component
VNSIASWIDRSGGTSRPASDAGRSVQMALSPDERRVAFQSGTPGTRGSDIWQLDLGTQVLSRVTSENSSVDPALWSLSGRDVIFANSEGRSIARKPVGGGETTVIWKADETVYPAQELKDGSILFHNQRGRSVSLLRPGSKHAEPLFESDYTKDGFHVSADERWISYSADETGRWEVYVTAFPSFKQRLQVSKNGGVQGMWRKDGKELFYLGLDGSMWAIQVRAGAEGLEASAPQMLFKTRITVRPTSDQFAVTGDGKRFLVLEPAVSEVTPWTVVVNWPATLQRPR